MHKTWRGIRSWHSFFSVLRNNQLISFSPRITYYSITVNTGMMIQKVETMHIRYTSNLWKVILSRGNKVCWILLFNKMYLFYIEEDFFSCFNQLTEKRKIYYLKRKIGNNVIQTEHLILLCESSLFWIICISDQPTNCLLS